MKNNEIKEKIIEETKKLIATGKPITIKDIADRCYMNIASVNYYFGSKDNLIQQVVEEIIQELKGQVLGLIELSKGKSKREILEMTLSYIYQYSLDNIGLISYLFLFQNNAKDTGKLFIDTFFTDNEFTQTIFKALLQEKAHLDPKEVLAQYTVLFSSFCMPLFITIAHLENPNSHQIETYKDSEFRNFYIKELLRVLEA